MHTHTKPKDQSPTTQAIQSNVMWSRVHSFATSYAGGISLTIILVVLANLIWSVQDKTPPHWDMARHLINADDTLIQFKKIFHADTFRGSLHEFKAFLYQHGFYPPLYYWLTLPFFIVFGRSIDIAVATNMLFVPIIFACLYSIGAMLWNKQTGFLASLAFGLSAFVSSQYHEYQLDMPLTAMTLLAFWTYLKSNTLRHPVWSLAFGASVGLAMMTKWTVLAFLAAPVGYTLLLRLIAIRPHTLKRELTNLFQNILLASLGFWFTGGWWYYAKFDVLTSGFENNKKYAIGEGDPDAWTPIWYRRYLYDFLVNYLRLPLIIPAVVGLVGLVISRRNLKRGLFALIWLVSGYIIMTLYPNKDVRFIEPAVPALMLLSVYWIADLIQPWRSVMSTYIILISIFHFLGGSWGTELFPFMAKESFVSLPDVNHTTMQVPVWRFRGYTQGVPMHEDWQQDNLMHLIANDMKIRNDIPNYAYVPVFYPNAIEFHADNLEVAHRFGDYAIKLGRPDSMIVSCQTSHYAILVQEGNLRDVVTKEFPIYKEFQYSIAKPEEAIKKGRADTPLCSLTSIYTSTLPNGKTLELFRITQN